MSATVVPMHGSQQGAWCWASVIEGLAVRTIAGIATDRHPS